jgi:hypothetical protein
MRWRLKSRDFLTALLLLSAGRGFALHTDPTRIEAGDVGRIAVPFESIKGGISPIENVRLEATNVPAWVDIDTAASFMGPTDIYPGETMTGSSGFAVHNLGLF